MTSGGPSLERRHRDPHARWRLYCFPPAAAPASMFNAWGRAFPGQVEVCGVELPGHGRRLHEAPIAELRGLVEATCETLLPELDRAFAIFGHSMGALVGYEVARHLGSRYQRQPAYLFVSGHRAPQLPIARPPLHRLDDRTFIEQLTARDGAPLGLGGEGELLQLILPVLRTEAELCETYEHVPGPLLACHISALGGVDDPTVTAGELRAWQAQTTGRFRLHTFPGGHAFIRTAGAEVAAALGQDLQLVG